MHLLLMFIVSILVLMDVGLRYNPDQTYQVPLVPVSILVLMDVGLRYMYLETHGLGKVEFQSLF